MFSYTIHHTNEVSFKQPGLHRSLRNSLTILLGCSVLFLGAVSTANADTFVLANQGGTIGGVSANADQLVEYDPNTNMAAVIFDGTAFQTANERINAVHILPNNNILLSTQSNGVIGNNMLAYNDEDVVAYNPTTMMASLFLDGSAVGSFLDINAVSILSSGNIVVSATGSGTIGSNTLMFDNNDLVEFNPNTNFANLLFDGGAMGFNGDIDGVHILSNGNYVLSTSASNLSFAGISFEDEDLVEYNPNSLTAMILYDDSVQNGGGLQDIRGVFVSQPSAVPEPGTMLLLGSGLAGLGFWRWKNTQKS